MKQSNLNLKTRVFPWNQFHEKNFVKMISRKIVRLITNFVVSAMMTTYKMDRRRRLNSLWYISQGPQIESNGRNLIYNWITDWFICLCCCCYILLIVVYDWRKKGICDFGWYLCRCAKNPKRNPKSLME